MYFLSVFPVLLLLTFYMKTEWTTEFTALPFHPLALNSPEQAFQSCREKTFVLN